LRSVSPVVTVTLVPHDEAAKAELVVPSDASNTAIRTNNCKNFFAFFAFIETSSALVNLKVG
jgi:hypothetical protein